MIFRILGRSRPRGSARSGANGAACDFLKIQKGILGEVLGQYESNETTPSQIGRGRLKSVKQFWICHTPRTIQKTEFFDPRLGPAYTDVKSHGKHGKNTQKF